MLFKDSRQLPQKKLLFEKFQLLQICWFLTWVANTFGSVNSELVTSKCFPKQVVGEVGVEVFVEEEGDVHFFR